MTSSGNLQMCYGEVNTANEYGLSCTKEQKEEMGSLLLWFCDKCIAKQTIKRKMLTMPVIAEMIASVAQVTV